MEKTKVILKIYGRKRKSEFSPQQTSLHSQSLQTNLSCSPSASEKLRTTTRRWLETLTLVFIFKQTLGKKCFLFCFFFFYQKKAQLVGQNQQMPLGAKPSATEQRRCADVSNCDHIWSETSRRGENDIPPPCRPWHGGAGGGVEGRERGGVTCPRH